MHILITVLLSSTKTFVRIMGINFTRHTSTAFPWRHKGFICL